MKYRAVRITESGMVEGFGPERHSIEQVIVVDEIANLIAGLFNELFPTGKVPFFPPVDVGEFLGWSHRGVPDGARHLEVEIKNYGTVDVAAYE